MIGWSYSPGTRQVGKVVVVEQIPDAALEFLGPPEWQDATFTFGACNSQWMRPDKPSQTPAGVFGEMLTGEGFASSKHATEALRQFAQIAECEWARAMLAAVPAEGVLVSHG